jgi:hypothetical protein
MDTTPSLNEADLQRDAKFAPLAPENLTNAEELLAKLAQGAGAATTNRPAAEADFSAGPRLAAVSPEVTFPPNMAPRPLGHEQATGKPSSRGRRAFRFLLAACIGVVATLAWQSYGAAGRRTIVSLISKPHLSSPPDITQPLPGAANQDPAGAAVEANAADGAPAPAAPLAQATADPTPNPVVTPPPASAEVLGQIEALTHDITAMRQSIEQLTAAQSEMARSIAALPAAEDARREQPASAPRRPAAARKPTPPPPPQRASQPLAPGPRPLSQSVASPPPATSPTPAPAPIPAQPQPPRPPGSLP